MLRGNDSWARLGLAFVFFRVGASFALANDRAASENSPRIVLTSPRNLEACQVAVRGVPASLQKQFSTWKADAPRWQTIFSLHVGTTPKPDQPAVLGTFHPARNGFTFAPRFGLEPGTSYRAVLSLPGRKPLREVFTLPAEKPDVPTTISAVYPTGNKLPENLLRLYLQFSAPMSQGNSYSHLHLYDQAGREVENPFLELPQELWTPDGKRLTVLLDPGRVKQGLKPREQSGPVLLPHRKYTLVIDADWQDATGHPLDKSFRRTFTTTPADTVQPHPRNWKIHPPKPGTRNPLTVIFEEPLDHGMLQRVISVETLSHKDIPGQIQIDREETRWQFRPASPWKAGHYLLRVRTNLEDRAGNSIARPFEVDLNKPQPAPTRKWIDREFEIPK